jgi:hypothetical protein
MAQAGRRTRKASSDEGVRAAVDQPDAIERILARDTAVQGERGNDTVAGSRRGGADAAPAAARAGRRRPRG